LDWQHLTITEYQAASIALLRNASLTPSQTFFGFHPLMKREPFKYGCAKITWNKEAAAKFAAASATGI